MFYNAIMESLLPQKTLSQTKQNTMFFAFFLILCIYLSYAAGACEDDPDYKKNTYQLIANKNYPVENYTVETSDNYVLTIFRIPNGNGYNGNNIQKPVMIIAHGFLGSSSNFVLNYPNQSLGFIAYDRGYDVWLVNFRGNTYARTNTEISNKNPLFWNFSWDEMALIDLPEMIDYILNKTKQSKVYLVGHSQGCPVILAMLAKKPDYQQKVIKAALLAPVVTVYYSENFLFKLVALKDFLPLLALATSATYGELLPNSAAFKLFVEYICAKNETEICKQLTSSLVSLSGPEYNNSRLCVYLSDFPAGSSAYCAVHYAQERSALVFQMYDYFPFNYYYYGQFTPPQYNLSLVKTRIGLYSSLVDNLTDQRDVDFIRKTIGTKPFADQVISDIPSFGHLAYAIGLNASDVVYTPMLASFGEP